MPAIGNRTRLAALALAAICACAPAGLGAQPEVQAKPNSDVPYALERRLQPLASWAANAASLIATAAGRPLAPPEGHVRALLAEMASMDLQSFAAARPRLARRLEAWGIPLTHAPAVSDNLWLLARLILRRPVELAEKQALVVHITARWKTADLWQFKPEGSLVVPDAFVGVQVLRDRAALDPATGPLRLMNGNVQLPAAGQIVPRVEAGLLANPRLLVVPECVRRAAADAVRNMPSGRTFVCVVGLRATWWERNMEVRASTDAYISLASGEVTGRPAKFSAKKTTGLDFPVQFTAIGRAALQREMRRVEEMWAARIGGAWQDCWGELLKSLPIALATTRLQHPG